MLETVTASLAVRKEKGSSRRVQSGRQADRRLPERKTGMVGDSSPSLTLRVGVPVCDRERDLLS